MTRVLSALTVIGLVGLVGCGGSHSTVTVASDGQTAETTGPSETTSTTTVPAVTTPTTEAITPTTGSTVPVPSTTTTSRPPTTTATRPPTTTTTRPAARKITLTTSPQGDSTKVIVRGDGCKGPEYGVTLTIRDPSGQDVSGDGGLAQPDGAWQLEEYFGHDRATGTYTFAASCIVSNGPVVFPYAPAPFDWAG